MTEGPRPDPQGEWLFGATDSILRDVKCLISADIVRMSLCRQARMAPPTGVFRQLGSFRRFALFAVCSNGLTGSSRARTNRNDVHGEVALRITPIDRRDAECRVPARDSNTP